MTDDRPVMEMSAFASTIAGRTLLVGLWLSDNNARPETVDAEIAFAKARGASSVYLHCDDPRHWDAVHAAAERVTEAGLVPIWGTNIVEGVTNIVDKATPLWGLTLNIRTVNKSPALLMAGIVDALEQVRTRPDCAMVMIFGWEHCEWSALKDWLVQVIHAVPQPVQYPGVVAPPVVTPPPVVPLPVIKPDTHKGKTAAIVSAAGGIGVFVAWLIRKCRRKQA
jgi:hypothetical protein